MHLMTQETALNVSTWKLYLSHTLGLDSVHQHGPAIPAKSRRVYAQPTYWITYDVEQTLLIMGIIFH